MGQTVLSGHWATWIQIHRTSRSNNTGKVSHITLHNESK
jgi:hypothetical protein